MVRRPEEITLPQFCPATSRDAEMLICTPAKVAIGLILTSAYNSRPRTLLFL
jgi:hypothetical protein